MRICSNAPKAPSVLVMHSMLLLKFHLYIYIYGGETEKPMKFSTNSFFVI